MGFIDAFKRYQLAQKGLSSGKKRRTSGERASTIDQSFGSRLLVWLGFLAGLYLLSLEWHEGFAGNSVLANSLYPGKFVIVALGAVAVAILNLNYEATADRAGRSLLTLGTVLLQVALTRLLVEVIDAKGANSSFKVLLAPYALAPLLLTVLINPRVGVFGTIMSGILGSLFMPLGWLLPFLVISFCSGIAITVTAQNVRKRGKLLRAGFYAGVVVFLLAFPFEIINENSWEQFISEGELEPIAKKLGAALGIGFLIALIISGLMPIIESLFSLTTNISWLELSDLNHKLLRRMQLEAPGTFHHSLVVASLAEAAAEEVGANAPMCRVCAYFHDIGKLNKPDYFIENQSGGINPHDNLTPTMSALVITAHVKDGVDLAMKHNLNPRVVDVIKEHHGDSLVYYFYRKAQEQLKLEEEKVGKGIENAEDLPQVSEKSFRYPGPTPQTIESGIISLADACESASRSLGKPTPAKISGLVNDIVNARIKDGQLDECPLTLHDLKVVKESFSKTLQSMLHSRIEYPKEEEKKGTKKRAKKKSEGQATIKPGLDAAPKPRVEEPAK